MAAVNGKSRGRRKTNWRTVNLAAYDPFCAGEFDLEEYAPPTRIRVSTKPCPSNGKPSSSPLFDDSVTTRSDWKYMGKQVRKMLIPGSISTFSSCMWVSLEIAHGSPIAAFSKIVELALPFWDALPTEDQEAWAERAFAEGRRAHWIYVRNGRTGGGSGVMGASSHVPSSVPRSRKKEWDDEYDEEELSDTDELPSRPTRKLNIDGDDVESPVPKDFKSEDATPLPERPAPVGAAKTVTFKIAHDEAPREPWRERDGTRTVPPPPLTYRPIIVSTNPPAQNHPQPSHYYPMQSSMRGTRGGGGGYMGRRPFRGGFDMHPLRAMSVPGASSAPLSVWSRGLAPPLAARGHMAAPPIGFR